MEGNMTNSLDDVPHLQIQRYAIDYIDE
jgi:hypothetical protein